MWQLQWRPCDAIDCVATMMRVRGVDPCPKIAASTIAETQLLVALQTNTERSGGKGGVQVSDQAATVKHMCTEPQCVAG